MSSCTVLGSAPPTMRLVAKVRRRLWTSTCSRRRPSGPYVWRSMPAFSRQILKVRQRFLLWSNGVLSFETKMWSRVNRAWTCSVVTRPLPFPGSLSLRPASIRRRISYNSSSSGTRRATPFFASQAGTMISRFVQSKNSPENCRPASSLFRRPVTRKAYQMSRQWGGLAFNSLVTSSSASGRPCFGWLCGKGASSAMGLLPISLAVETPQFSMVLRAPTSAFTVRGLRPWRSRCFR
jgi:hypothetical protein